MILCYVDDIVSTGARGYGDGGHHGNATAISQATEVIQDIQKVFQLKNDKIEPPSDQTSWGQCWSIRR